MNITDEIEMQNNNNNNDNNNSKNKQKRGRKVQSGTEAIVKGWELNDFVVHLS